MHEAVVSSLFKVVTRVPRNRPENKAQARWLLLVHQIPPKPAYFRVKIWRRLGALGAVALKNSVYVLPNTSSAREDFEWTVREISSGGGEAMVCEARIIEGLSDAEIVRMIQAARDQDYLEIANRAKKLSSLLRSAERVNRVDGSRRVEVTSHLARLKRRLTEVAAIDFFEARMRKQAEEEIAAVESRFLSSRRPGPKLDVPKPACRPEEFRHRTWVTRKGIHVDRMASAWLIRRFIDPAARFVFVSPHDYRPKHGHVRFDMFEAEFTHEGNHCTFEVLYERFGLKDRALLAIGEIIHDIDLKEMKFAREETPGIRRLISGISLNHAEDTERLARGCALFDDLYECFRRQGERTLSSPLQSPAASRGLV